MLPASVSVCFKIKNEPTLITVRLNSHLFYIPQVVRNFCLSLCSFSEDNVNHATHFETAFSNKIEFGNFLQDNIRFSVLSYSYFAFPVTLFPLLKQRVFSG